MLGGTDTATASDQTSRQSADNRLWMHTSPAGPTQPGQSLPVGALGMMPASQRVPPRPGLVGSAPESPVCTAQRCPAPGLPQRWEGG